MLIDADVGGRSAAGPSRVAAVRSVRDAEVAQLDQGGVRQPAGVHHGERGGDERGGDRRPGQDRLSEDIHRRSAQRYEGCFIIRLYECINTVRIWIM